jgi:NAD(P)-dependent dehydrogenase (short-subunit alcohol dehydrogenase family)
MSARPLDGRTALVTGGSRGIGRAICLALAEAGAAVAFTFREREDQAANVCSELEALGAKPLSIKMEVSDRASVEAARNRLATRWPALNVLVNNAGINKPTDFDQITDADWDQILAVNLTGPFIVTQTFWPMLTAAHGASVIHIGSVSGQYGGPRTAHYAASKAGLISLGQVIARFGAKHRIRSNTLAAGLISSEMAANALNNPAVAAAAANIPMGRMGAPDEVAKACVFLASDAASYVTAQTLNVNGGLYF